MRSNMISGVRPAALARFALTNLLALTVFAIAGLAQAATLPTPPLLFDTPYVAPTGRIVNVPAGGDFQAALNNAQLGDTIVLEAGATYTGPFTLPNKTSGSGWIYIQSSVYPTLPGPGNRVTLQDASKMPRIVVASGRGSAVQTAANAHHFRFVGVHFLPVTGNFVYQLVGIGAQDVSTATLPHDITFDRCIFQGDPTVGARRGIAMDGRNIAVIDSSLSDFKEVGADTQAAWAHNTPGPLKLVNNYLEAAGENVMFGGADSKAASLLPSDIEISRNHFFKPLSWVGSKWQVKNLLEFKAGQRVLVRGNRFENNWAAAQAGFSLLITPRNQDGTAPWTATRDIAIENNLMLNLGSGINILGADDIWTSERTVRVEIRNNLVQTTALNGANGRLLQVLAGPDDIVVENNTGFAVQALAVSDSPSGDIAANFVFRNNIVTAGEYGFTGTGTADGRATLAAYYGPEYVFTRNAIVGVAGTNYPTSNFFPVNLSAVGFVDLQAGNYRLSVSSPYKNAGTDGRDLGANMDDIAAAMATPSSSQVRKPQPPSTVTVN